jgi:hypothetical protein
LKLLAVLQPAQRPLRFVLGRLYRAVGTRAAIGAVYGLGYGVRTRGISRAPFRFLFLACTSMLKIEESTAHQQHHDSDRNTPTQISKEADKRLHACTTASPFLQFRADPTQQG